MKKATPLQVIKAKCFDCSYNSYKEVRLCTAEDCALTLLGSVRSQSLLARSHILQILMQKSEGFYPDFMKVVSRHAIS